MKHLHPLYNVAEIEIHYRSSIDPYDKVYLGQSEHANTLLRGTWDDNKICLLEQFKILLIDVSGHCFGISEIATGGKTHCVVDPRIIFSTALKANASNIILAHNHPSGNLTPSSADIKMTNELVQAGKLLEINVFDHLIITDKDYYSFADNGLFYR
jgi:DNA repair protein RadC